MNQENCIRMKGTCNPHSCRFNTS